jgi:hypothetical protein
MPRPGPTSRYANVGTATYTTPEGREIVHLRRRFVPAPEDMVPLDFHRVRERDRLDRIAAASLGDPEQFWRICDANRAVVPRSLTERIGTILTIPMPQED